MSKKSRNARMRRHRRLSKARIKSRKVIVKHRLKSGRTGSMHTKKLMSRGK